MKTRRVYHFCEAKYGLENIRKRRIKVSTFDDLNDPFELMCHDTSDPRLRSQLNQLKQTVEKEQGILCFSKDYSSPVQWAHYADRHRGICLGFDMPEEYLEDVIYRTKRIDFKAQPQDVIDGFDRQLRELLTTKYKHWSYEREVRSFGTLGVPDPSSGLYFSAFSEHMTLKEVIVGSGAAISRADLYEAIGDLEPVVCFKVRAAFRSYTMVKNKDDSLWK
ncbi:DUF2971 domain-containing protein [Pseudomonas alliivorans]|uniref:DUF2971 domain-containing protein n=1 Tax=Pseudomonas alliivorans TaxID=2810613 RepID=A0ABS4C684_9PSED|nr:DUF2971 domain-containing protein [Pseudomonas alliivorans]MBP0945811.1 DUF2971 domain-containing protein [Pseudomonas alliivorans]MEE4326333.1 DUF2971 domain-containing protein [Pseudomonas alliivorans]MEE4367863.1 DUF2971 domain-containing protein [Pseudomonas alliivorans]MEE4919842.1 DUF2971 domain-containing protein [Pseudomonas alliivorans]MEE5054565.1 DUF2971 domain-containing protein [Pseudomonas alliivorans]